MKNKMTTSKNKNTIIIENFQVPHYKWWDNSKAKVQIKFANDVKTILDNLNVLYQIKQMRYWYDEDDEIITVFENIKFPNKKTYTMLECFKIENDLKISITEASFFIEVCSFPDCKTRGVRINTCQDITVKKLENYRKKLNELIILRNKMKKIEDLNIFLKKDF